MQWCFRLSMRDWSLCFIHQSRAIKHDLVLVLSSRKCCGGLSLHSGTRLSSNCIISLKAVSMLIENHLDFDHIFISKGGY